MPEIIGIREIQTNYDHTLAKALEENGFDPFRVHPDLRNESKFRPALEGSHPGLSHFFEVPAGYELRDLPEALEDRVIRNPRDLWEVIALGKTINEEKCEFTIYAPEITGEARKFLKIHRWPGWKGLGLTIKGFNPDDENLWDLQFIGFSDP